jgi:hypothetical protein
VPRQSSIYMFVYGECCRRGSGSGEPGTDEWRYRDREAAINMAKLLITFLHGLSHEMDIFGRPIRFRQYFLHRLVVYIVFQ